MATADDPPSLEALRPYAELPARPWVLAPPLRIATSASADPCLLHTVQSADAYEELRTTGVLTGEPWRGDPSFAEAYDWMLRQLDARGLPGPRGRMLWLHASTTRRTLRRCARLAPGEVMLSVQMPRQSVLTSDFGAWHAVLNRILHLPREPDESDADWEARCTVIDDDFTARAEPYDADPLEAWPLELRSELETSWEAIFDPRYWEKDVALQATVRELHAEDVLRAVRMR